jgi:phenazine biosynthesis protein phzE
MSGGSAERGERAGSAVGSEAGTAARAAAEPADLLARVLAPGAGPFALLYRPQTAPDAVEVLAGTVSYPGTLAELPLHQGPQAPAGHDVLALLPYRQIGERGFAHVDDGTPLVALKIARRQRLPLADALDRLPDLPIRLTETGFDVSDAEYAERVRRVVADEIGRGEGANFVLRRSFTAVIEDYAPRDAVVLFRRLLERGSGAHWVFVVHTGDRTLVGASPERHVSLAAGTAVMNPISGTYRYPAGGPTLPGVMDFLADRKEADELYMVVDEELKMMARICEDGARMEGPYLKEMAHLAHTEYFLHGGCARDPREVLAETMFAPTVTGSPLESACRVIATYEPDGRGYYSGVAALIGRDGDGAPSMDSAILIRTADIDARGGVRIGVGATLVRHSDPDSEVAETAAKATGLLTALRANAPAPAAPAASTAPAAPTAPAAGTAPAASIAAARPAPALGEHPDVRAALAARNATVAGYWLGADPALTAPDPELAGLRVLMVDAEDTFTAMVRRQLVSLGLDVTLRRYDEPYSFDDGHDLVVMGPGPGDPARLDHPKIAHLHDAVGRLLAGRRRFLAVCLSHQVLSLRLGFELVRKDPPNQGLQRAVDLFGTAERVGLYNTFTAVSAEDKQDVEGVGPVEVCRDPATGDVYALRGPHFASTQFHAESVLTQHGPAVLAGLLRGLL